MRDDEPTVIETEEELGQLLSRAKDEHWTQLKCRGESVGEAGARAIAQLTGLTSLELGSNNIGDEGAKSIAQLTGLTSLELGNNNIGDEGAKAIAQLTGLTSLNLWSNNIGEAGAQAIAQLTGLTSLDLWSNDIGEAGAQAIAQLTGLTSLDLWSNDIGEAGAKAIAQLTGLTSLNLWGNNIGEAGAKAIAQLTGLTSLELGDNNIGDAGTKAIAQLTGLTSLDLGSNDIGEAGTQAIAQLTGLTSLYLGNNSIGDEEAKTIAQLTGLTSLYLGGNNIGEAGAKAIAQLTGLTSLYLGNNNIGEAGAKVIAQLTGLASLDLGGNDIGEAGAKAIAQLTGLTSLDLGGNDIGDEGAKAIAQLTGLTSLYLGSNNIGEAGAKAIAQLTGLTSLDLGSNNIGDEGAKAIAQLTGLTSLDLGGNDIGETGLRALLESLLRATGRRRLRRLSLKDNKDLGTLLPKEVLESGDAQAILAAYRRYKDAGTAETLLPLNEAKMLVVGNEDVGKTSLINFLVHNRPRDPDEKKTPGTSIHDQIETKSWFGADGDVRLNVWDFGGQEVMHGTHRYFLTARSLYLLVLEDRREDDRSIDTWCKTIRNRGGDAPIIVVINKSDEGKEALRLDEVKLKEDNPGIIRFFRTSCNDDEWSKQRIVSLRKVIAETLREHPELEHARTPIPESWLRVKTEISRMANEESVLPFISFQELCKGRPSDKLKPEDVIDNPDEQRALLRLLHDLGVIVAHGLKEGAPAAMREINLLDPNWLTGAIYTLLNEKEIKDQTGRFKKRQLSDWLDTSRYPKERHEFILSMMEDPQVGLCFCLPGTDGKEYLLPEALPRSKPRDNEWPEDCLRFRYRYAFLPPGLISRFMVEAHRNLTDPELCWHSGAVLQSSNCSILVDGDVTHQKIDILVDGPKAQRRAALNVVLNYFDIVHKLNPEIGAEERVPLPDNLEMDESYEHLLKLEEKRGPEYRHWPQGVEEDYAVGDLLDGVRRSRIVRSVDRKAHFRESQVFTVDQVVFASDSASVRTKRQTVMGGKIEMSDDRDDASQPTAMRAHPNKIKFPWIEFELELPQWAAWVLAGLVLGGVVVWWWPAIEQRFPVGFETAVPTLIEPANAVTLTAYPRMTYLSWQQLPGAVRYTVEVQMQDIDTGEWLPHPNQSRWTTTEQSLMFEFIGDQPGRWQVVAIAEDGTSSQPSVWYEFFYETVDPQSEELSEDLEKVSP